MGLKPDIQLNIDNMVFDGFTEKESLIIGKTFKHELHRLIDSNGLSKNLQNKIYQDIIRAEAMKISHNMSSHHIGAQLANTVYDGLSREHVSYKK